MGRTPRPMVEDDYELFKELISILNQTDQKKQAAVDVLSHYSQFAMVCIGQGVRPADLRLHLMKELSGLPTALKKESMPIAASPDSAGEPSSSGSSKGERS